MPLTVGPDPSNPGKWIWIDSATGQPATQPGGPGTPYVAQSDTPNAVQVPAAGNIDPNAGRPPATTFAPTTQPTTGLGAPQSQGPNPSGTAGQYTVEQILAPFDTEFANANQAVLDLNTTINGRHGARDAQGNPLPDVTGDAEALQQAQTNAVPGVVDPALTAAQTKYQADLSAWSAAQQRLAAANVARQNALQTAIDKNELVPGQAELARAQANESSTRAAQIQQQTKIASDLAPSQMQLLVSQGAQAAAQAELDRANAAKAAATTPSDIALANAQAAQAQANANAVTTMVAVNQAKVQADTTLTQHQVGLTDAQSQLAQAQAVEAGARGRLADAQAALTGVQGAQLVPAQAALAQAQAGTELAKQKQALLGPMYGLQDQLNAIRTIQQQVFGPGGSGNADDANKLLQDYVTATVSGTTPYAASVAAANYGQNIFGTQAALANAAQSAAASRANAFLGAGANVLGTLASMNANAPAGSTAGAQAFQDVMNQMMTRVGGQQAFAPPTLPQAPALPALLARFGQPAGIPAPQPAAAPAAAAAPNAGAGAVNINIGTSGQTTTATPTPPGGYAANQPGTYGALSGSMPSLLQNYSPITDVGQLGAAMSKIWGYS